MICWLVGWYDKSVHLIDDFMMVMYMYSDVSIGCVNTPLTNQKLFFVNCYGHG